MHLKTCALLVCFIFGVKVGAEVSDYDYYSIPPVFHVDDFDRCMALKEKALYCSVQVQLFPIRRTRTWSIIEELISSPKNYRHDILRHGVCIPESCNITRTKDHYDNDDPELQEAITKCYNAKYKSLELRTNVTELHCETDQPFYPIDNYDYAVGIGLALLFVIVIFGTCYEGRARYKTKEEYDSITKTTFGKLTSSFSIPKNWARLTAPNTHPDAEALKFVNGMRFYTILGVVMAHTSMMGLFLPNFNTQFAEGMVDDPNNILMVNGGYAIQVFFVMSGWLLIYNFLTTFKNKNIPLGYFITAFVHRYLRLTPPLLAVVAVSSTWIIHADRGPFWDRAVGREYRNCRMNWWTNLLYINNYYDVSNMCIQQTWYLAADTQVYIIILILIMILWKFKKYTSQILGLSVIGSLLILGIVNYVKNYDVLVRHYAEPLYDILLHAPEWTVMYIAGYTNIIGYVIGLILGYIFYYKKDQKLFTKKKHVVFWWIMAWLPGLIIVGLAKKIYEDDFVTTPLGAAFYTAFARSIYAFSIGLAMFGFSQGLGWVIRDIVRWQPVQTLGRLTYCVYLVHVGVIRVRGGQARSPYYITKYSLIIHTLGDICMSFIMALILCLFVEMPTSALQKMLIPRRKKKSNVSENGTLDVKVVSTETTDNSVSRM